MGYFGEVVRDFTNCFVDKDGTDIQVSKQTNSWFFSVKLKIVNKQLIYFGRMDAWHLWLLLLFNVQILDKRNVWKKIMAYTMKIMQKLSNRWIIFHSALKSAKKYKKFVKSLFTKFVFAKKCNLTRQTVQTTQTHIWNAFFFNCRALFIRNNFMENDWTCNIFFF